LFSVKICTTVGCMQLVMSTATPQPCAMAIFMSFVSQPLLTTLMADCFSLVISVMTYALAGQKLNTHILPSPLP